MLASSYGVIPEQNGPCQVQEPSVVGEKAEAGLKESAYRWGELLERQPESRVFGKVRTRWS